MKPSLNFHRLLGVPVLFPMPEPPASKFANFPDGSIDTAIVEVENREIRTNLNPMRTMYMLPFIEAIVNGDIREADGTDTWDIIFEKMFVYTEFQ